MNFNLAVTAVVLILLSSTSSATTPINLDLYSASTHWEKRNREALNEAHPSLMLQIGRYRAGLYRNSFNNTVYAVGRTAFAGFWGEVIAGVGHARGGYCGNWRTDSGECGTGDAEVFPLITYETPKFKIGRAYLKGVVYPGAFGVTFGTVIR